MEKRRVMTVEGKDNRRASDMCEPAKWAGSNIR
jgi:hypothetical protein